MPNVHLITFGDGSKEYQEAAQRLIASSHAFSSINFRRAYKKEDLSSEYSSLFKESVRNSPVGFGLYSWKPYLVARALNAMDGNDILVYIDSGCELNQNGIKRFEDYLSITSENSILTFEMQIPQRFWTKRHPKLLSAFPEHYFRNQVAGGIFFIKKNEYSLRFCTEWLAISSYQGGETLLDPAPDEEQIPGFRAHRHDQSTLSHTVYLNNAHHIRDETYFTNWSDAIDHPILALRNRTGAQKYQEMLSISNKFKNWNKSIKEDFRQRRQIQENKNI